MGYLTLKINVSILAPVASLLKDNPKRVPLGQVFKRDDYEAKNFRLITHTTYPNKDEVFILIEEIVSKKFSTNIMTLTLSSNIPHEELEETVQICDTTKKEQEYNGEHNHTDEETCIRLSIAELINRRHLLSDLTILDNEITVLSGYSNFNVRATLECDPNEYKLAEE